MADWKNTPKIDAHVHILPDDVIAANQGVEDPFVQAGGVDEYVRLMDRYQMDRAIVMPFNDPFLMSMEFSIEAVHRNMMRYKARYPDRFLLFADIDVREPIDRTLSELSRVMATGAFAGVKVHPTNADLPLDGAYFDAVFAYAEENGIPSAVHCYPADMPPEDVCAPWRLRKVMANHPSLRVCASHLGGFAYEDLLGLDVWVDISASLPDMVSRLGVTETNRILRMFPADRLIFATDYPASRTLPAEEIYPAYFSLLEQMDFTDTEIAALCRANLLRFLNIDA